MTSVSQQRVELVQPASSVLSGPILLGVVLLAVIIRQFFGAPPNPVVVGIGSGLLILTIVWGAVCMRNIGATLVVTPDEIRFTNRHKRGTSARSAQVIQRAENSMLTFRVARNGPFGSDYTGYALKMRDTGTGKEIYAGIWGRRKVQQACESQGWTFS